MTKVLNVSGLTFRHSSKKRWLKKPEVFALGPIDMQVTKGETIAIIGQNRSGKSLLAKMLPVRWNPMKAIFSCRKKDTGR